MKRWIATVAIFCSGTVSATTGNDLLTLLQSQQAESNLQAYYYIMGVAESENINLLQELFTSLPNKSAGEKAPKKFSRAYSCAPNGTTNQQVFDIVQRHLEHEPETRHQSGVALIRRALARAWPCGGNP
jgi:hypothetical protein